MNKLYTAQEVADRLKIKKTTVYELIKRGELESSKIGKQLRISEEQLSRYLHGGNSSQQDIHFSDVPPECVLGMPTGSITSKYLTASVKYLNESANC